ncbi:MAG TPA: ABC transporter permease, partial [Coriobacteriia bacterium]|nr:ABC transporter permease [Coriobacteriia bacterium]
MNVSLTLAWRYLWGRKLRTLLTTLAVVFGVAIIFGLNGMLPGMIDAFNRTLVGAAGQVDLSVTSASNGYFDPAIAEEVSDVEGVAAATPALRRPVGMPAGGPVTAIQIVGIEPRTAMQVREFAVASGRMLAAGDRGNAVIGLDTAEKLRVRLGGHITVPTVSGVERLAVVGLLASGSSPGTPEVYVTLADAGRMLGTPGKVSNVDGRLTPGADRATVEEATRRALGADYNVGGLSTENQLLASLKVSQFAFTMFGVFALIMGGFIILNTFRTLVSERRHDIGMLRAIGADRRTVLGVFLAQSVLQGVLGTALGLAAGYLLAAGGIAGITPIWRDTLHMDLGVIQPQFTPATWALAILLGVGVTVLGAIIPARQAARITPLEALRPQLAEVTERGHRKAVLVGWIVLGLSIPLLVWRNSTAVGIGAVFFLVGLILIAPVLIEPLSRALSRIIQPFSPATADLANSNLTRQPGRAAATASAILISLAVVVSMVGLIASIFAGFFDYIDKSLGSDFVLIPQGLILGGSHVGADQDLVDRIAETPGVSEVATMRIGMAKINGGQVQMVGIDPETYPNVASFTFSEDTSEADLAELGTGRTMMVNGIYAA